MTDTQREVRTIAVLPARNEAGRIEAVLRGLAPLVAHVIVVDDESEDNTGAVAARAGAQVIRNSRRLGVGGATVVGLKAALVVGADVLVTLDADGQHGPEWVNAVASQIVCNRADVVFGNRFVDLTGIPETKQLSNLVAWDFVRQVRGSPPIARDVCCGFRAYSTRGAIVAANSGLESLGYAFVQSSHLLFYFTQLNLETIQIPAVYPQTMFGTPVGEMRDFLKWISRFEMCEDVANGWIAALHAHEPYEVEVQSWNCSDRVSVLAMPNGDHLLFQLK